MQQTNPIPDEYGNRRWFKDGQLHRVDGPAIEYINGARAWFQHDHLHRLNGPAVELANGQKNWYLNDVEYTEDQFRLMAFVNSQVAV
jgi:hypothetical protein